MNTISQYQAAYAAQTNYSSKSTEVKEQKVQGDAAEKTDKKNKITGNTVGNPELSDKAKKYYESLKKKYKNMDFVLVSEDKKDEAKAHAADYAKGNRMVVLIDTDKIEKMASDESFRKQYEGIISGAANQMDQIMANLGNAASSVKTIGMEVKDGGKTSFFAIVDKSFKTQKKNAEKQAEKRVEEKKQAKKAEEKRAEKKKLEKEKLEDEQDDTETITADSLEELIKKIQDAVYSGMSNNTQTEEEKMVGQHIDFRG